MAIEVKPVRLAVAEDSEATLIFKDGALVAILSRLSSDHEERTGTWHIEIAFDPHLHGSNRNFEDLDEACAYFGRLRN